MPEEVIISEVKEITDEVVQGWARLMPQLSTSAPAPTKGWLEEIINSDSVLFAATQNGRMVGSLTLVLCRIPVGLKAWIEDVVVDENLRGQRIGEKLTYAAIERSKRENAKNLNLTSNPAREAAHKLYTRVGFEERETKVYRLK